ncbi:MAG: aminotransferase class V-fold PLP-dependent enzyme [Candidatus Krumholzibacteria bacterium]|nr:aminotransferase class V-fold PLP-dependent enzyme [Candidatus Krumholzibacteria bacterium]
MKKSGTKIDWNRYRAEFPAAEHYIYFNHAAVSPLSTRVIEAMNAVATLFLKKGILCEEEVFASVKKTRGAAAQLVGANGSEIAFIKNTTQGVLLAANGIRWKRGDNVVMGSIEFPANAYPWLALNKRGVRTVLVRPREGRITAEMLAGACTRKTRCVTVSSVQFSTGYRIDLAALGRFCRDRGIYLHVDGIQSLGMLQCNVRAMNIDFLSAGGHKWLLGPSGTGFFYCRREILDELDVWNPGWLGVRNARSYLAYDPTPRPDAQRYEEGSLNLYGIAGLGASIERFLEIGMARVERRIIDLTDVLEQGLRSRGYRITSPRGKDERSGIICFTHARKDAEKIFRRLSAAGIVVSLRVGAIRLAPHFYNTADEAERVLDLL